MAQQSARYVNILYQLLGTLGTCLWSKPALKEPCSLPQEMQKGVQRTTQGARSVEVSHKSRELSQLSPADEWPLGHGTFQFIFPFTGQQIPNNIHVCNVTPKPPFCPQKRIILRCKTYFWHQCLPLLFPWPLQAGSLIGHSDLHLHIRKIILLNIRGMMQM